MKAKGSVASGNPKLILMGAIPFPSEPWENLQVLFPLREDNGSQNSEADALIDAYSLVIERILTLLKKPQTGDWLVERMSVRDVQMKGLAEEVSAKAES